MSEWARAACEEGSVCHAKGTWGEYPVPAADGGEYTTASLVVGRQGAEIASGAIAHLAPQSELSGGGVQPKGLQPQAYLDMRAGVWDPHALLVTEFAHKEGGMVQQQVWWLDRLEEVVCIKRCNAFSAKLSELRSTHRCEPILLTNLKLHGWLFTWC